MKGDVRRMLSSGIQLATSDTAMNDDDGSSPRISVNDVSRGSCVEPQQRQRQEEDVTR